MRPVCVFANAPSDESEQLRAELRGRWRQAGRAVMVLLSLHGLSAAQIGDLLDCHPATVRRWISRFSRAGLAGRAAAGPADRRAAGPARALDAAADLARPGPPAGQQAHAVPAGAPG